VKPLGEIVTIHKGRKAAEVCEKTRPGAQRYLQIDDLRPDATVKYAVDANGVVATERDILIAWDGANAGTTGYSLNGYAGSTLAVLRIKDPDVYTPFLGRFLQNKFTYLRERCTGATIPHVERTSLEELEVPLPLLDEQKRIATLLDKADRLRRSRRYVQKLSDSFLQSVFLEIFGDPVTNQMGWEVIELGSLLQNIDSGWSPNCDAARTRRDQWAVLRLSAVTYGIYKPEENKRLPPGVCPRPELEVKRGDVLFTRKNTYDLVGACVLVHATPPNLMLPDTIFRFRVASQSKLMSEYLFGLLNSKSYKRQVQLLASGTAGSMPNISKEKLLELRLPLPPQSAQSKFKAAVERYERICNQQTEAERQAEHLFQTLLYRAFSN